MSLEFYTNRIETLAEKKTVQKKKISLITSARIASFILFVIIIVVAIQSKNSDYFYFLILPIILFGILLKFHQREKLKLNILSTKIKINQQEINCLNGNYSEFENGKEFINSQHGFSHDIDLFGEKSLFQFLNRTTSSSSKKRFANYLSNYNSKQEEITNRQEAVKEASTKNAWREEFRANGLLFKTKESNINEVANWRASEIALFENIGLWRVILWAVPIFMLVVIVGVSYSLIPAFYLLIASFIPLGITARKLKIINEQHLKISEYLEVLKQHSILSNLIENEKFKSEQLQLIKSALVDNNKSANTEIKELANITQQLDNRSNPVFAILMNALFLWDLQYLLKLKNWLAKNENSLQNWFEAVDEMEVYASLGNFAFNQSEFNYPELSQTHFFEAEELGHPLLSENSRITSSLTINNLQEFVIITGANMAGKSTFLRAVGINLVLASSGAPVCAKSFSYTPTQLFTSMRTSDSLSDNESYFYSELKRLQTIVEKLKSGEKLFVILDEILKGTNSKDKAEGSKKFVKQLLNYQASGIIATHDLSLCSIKEDFPTQVQTHYFDVEIENDELVFDYKLKEGICSNMNAEFLMKKMGITE